MSTPQNNPQKNTYLIVLAAVSAFVALLLFLDPWLSIFPESMDLPDLDGKDPVGENGVGVIGGEETKKSWWDKIFDNDRDEPRETDAPDTPDAEESTFFADTDFPSVEGGDLFWECYTEKELLETYYATLVQSFYRLAEMETAGMILPIDKVGFFNLDGYGAPEIITMGVYNGSVEYTAYELYSLEALSSWGWEGTQYGELSLWATSLAKSIRYESSLLSSSSIVYMSTSRSLITHAGDGDDHYVCEITRDRLIYKELFAQTKVKPFQNSSMTMISFRLDGQKTDEKTYTEAYERFKQENNHLTKTTMIAVDWEAGRPESMAENVLTFGQQFLYMGK